MDSGNFAASYYTLRSGALALIGEPILPAKLFSALRDHSQLVSLQELGRDRYRSAGISGGESRAGRMDSVVVQR